MINLKDIKKVHIIGVGGIGISAIARLMISLGKEVSGSDLVDSDITAKLRDLGATIAIGQHKAENVSDNVDLILYTDAVPLDNTERQKTSMIKGLSYFEFLGE